MLNSLIDLNAPSKISLERREELNQLAIRAAKSEGDVSDKTQCLEILRCECYKMEEIYQEIADIGGTHDHFFHNIDIAFKKLVLDKPESFDTYTQLARLLRVLVKHTDLIYSKMSEADKIVADIEILEAESMKGVSHHE